MGEGPVVGVRYCGGCNPRFDRPALLRALAARLPGAEFVPAQSHTPYRAAVILCGCPAACAGRADLAVPPARQVSLNSPEELDRAAEQIAALVEVQRE